MPTRRTFLQHLSIAAGLGAAASIGLPLGSTHSYDDVVDELFDVAITAMTAAENTVVPT